MEEREGHASRGEEDESRQWSVDSVLDMKGADSEIRQERQNLSLHSARYEGICSATW